MAAPSPSLAAERAGRQGPRPLPREDAGIRPWFWSAGFETPFLWAPAITPPTNPAVISDSGVGRGRLRQLEQPGAEPSGLTFLTLRTNCGFFTKTVARGSHPAVTHTASFSCWRTRWVTHRRVYIFKLHPAALADSSVGFFAASTWREPGCGVLAGEVGRPSVPACRGRRWHRPLARRICLCWVWGGPDVRPPGTCHCSQDTVTLSLVFLISQNQRREALARGRPPPHDSAHDAELDGSNAAENVKPTGDGPRGTS